MNCLEAVQMVEALKAYLESKGYKNVTCDFMPDVSKRVQAINLAQWSHTVGSINDGTGTRYIQVQCRDTTRDKAYKTCVEIFKLLDSGTEEHVINLTDTVFCIARPRRGPLLLERGSGYVTFYCEIALWGEN